MAMLQVMLDLSWELDNLRISSSAEKLKISLDSQTKLFLSWISKSKSVLNMELNFAEKLDFQYKV